MALINITASGNNLVKTGGCDGCGDASAVADQPIAGGNGFVEFVAAETGTLRFIGLGYGGPGTGADGIDFALRLQNGIMEVREAGGYRAETGFAAGDVLRVAVDGGAVRYLKNGSVFYASAGVATDVLRVHVAMFGAGGAIDNVVIGTVASAAAAVNGATPATVTTSPTRLAQPRPAGSVPQRRR